MQQKEKNNAPNSNNLNTKSGILNQTFLSDVLEGLSHPKQKTLPSKYFYDDKGSELFRSIMALPEYYLTRAEMDIFQNKTIELITTLALEKTIDYNLVELGPGDGTKTIHLLKELLQQGYSYDYLPIDISQHALDGLVSMLAKEVPSLTVKPLQGDYFVKLSKIMSYRRPKIVLVLGSNIGNLSDNEAAAFIEQLSANLNPGDKILLGVDLIKPKEIVLPAYSDAQGVTAAFNLNLLDRINRELAGDFDHSQFEHKAEYEAAEGVARSYLVSKTAQTVTICGQSFYFDQGESIHMEISRKYNDAVINEILKNTGINILTRIMDSRQLFADYVLIRS
ncbi:MAG: L-histidine N(alpha)-methyltransferase [Sphingobacteriales bacterium]|nr:MAG: L-histidine N(alpha)-methyltransferase [Sphingobacteriales bacterium]